MTRSIDKGSNALWVSLLLAISSSACQQAPPTPPLVAQVSGTIGVTGLAAPVRVVRDRWGVPHIYAQSQHDLFFAQGFVQAQDRLFQMDLWRRSTQGRLSEVLGSNFIERDVMTREMQYRGDMTAEWTSYAPDAQAIATAFVQGVNAWVAIAREQPPEEFIAAGWRPEAWAPEDLLNRTDAFLASGNGLDEVFRARLVAALGPARADALLPLASGRTAVPRGLDVDVVSYQIADQLRSVGTTPFFSNAWVAAGHRTISGSPLLAIDPHRALDHPSGRYLVHLSAPGWNVIGAASPWLPGVVIGHNERLAWGMTGLAADVQDLYVETLNPADRRQVEEQGRFVATDRLKGQVIVKGSQKPFEFDRDRTARGVMVGADLERNLGFSLRWTGTEAGTAGELAALAIDRAGSSAEFIEALSRWKLPAATFVFADVAGDIESQQAGLVPVRFGWTGSLPVPAASGAYTWRGWRAPQDLPRISNPGSGIVFSANDNAARTSRLGALLAPTAPFDIDAFKRFQHDTLAVTAERLVPLLSSLHAEREDVEQARLQLLSWDKRLTTDSAPGALYVIWERALFTTLAQRKLPPALADELLRLGRFEPSLVEALARPSRAWFDGNVSRSRDDLLLESLASAVDRRRGLSDGAAPWGRLHSAIFKHPLAVRAAARARFNVGPFDRPGYADTVMSTGGLDLPQTSGATFSAIFDLADWDRSVATNAPGQSGSPASAHFADLAKLWASGEYFPLPFSEEAVRANTESTLTLTPK